jgi:hypothetical protein
MKTTHRKHWVNGYQIRGGWHKTFTMSCYFYAVMFSWGGKSKLQIELFKLI